MKARQIQFNGVGQLEYVTRELPPLKADEVLVKIEACGLCTWERYIWAGTEQMPFPFVGGHELAATVLDRGADVAPHIRAGMPAAIVKWKRCGECEPCRRGYDNHCTRNSMPSDTPYSGPGGFSDYLICKSYEVFPFSPAMPIHFAALAEPVACVTRAVNRLNLVAGDNVAVVGAGLMGLLFLKLLRHRGCDVIVVQRSQQRRDMARGMGAKAVLGPEHWVERVLEETFGQGAAAVVYTAGGSAVVNQCLQAARLGAVVMLYAPTHEELPPLDLDTIHFKELILTGSLQHDKESVRQAVRLLGSGSVDFSDLNLVFGDFSNLEQEMRRADEDRDIHRILLRWND